MIIFSHFWVDTPKQHIAKIIWNNYERFCLPCKFAPQLFGIIVNSDFSPAEKPEIKP